MFHHAHWWNPLNICTIIPPHTKFGRSQNITWTKLFYINQIKWKETNLTHELRCNSQEGDQQSNPLTTSIRLRYSRGVHLPKIISAALSCRNSARKERRKKTFTLSKCDQCCQMWIAENSGLLALCYTIVLRNHYLTISHEIEYRGTITTRLNSATLMRYSGYLMWDNNDLWPK